MWDSFANKPDEQQFNSYTTEKWKEHFRVFAAALKKKALKKKLDATSLGKALELILKHSCDKLAYLPVGAYQTKLDGKPTWIVTVKWEDVDPGEHLGLGHIRAFAYDQATLKQVGFMTCD